MKFTNSTLAVIFLGSSLCAQQAREMQIVSAGIQGPPTGISIASENADTSALMFRDSGNETVWLRLSDGRGLQWSPPVRLDDDTTGAVKETHKHSLQVDGNKIYAAWLDQRNGPGSDLYFTSSLDGGLSWSPTNIRLDDGFASGNNIVRNYRLASSGNDLAALISTDDGNERLFITWSNDGGATWAPAESVTSHNGTADIDDIALVCSNDFAYIAWRDNFINGVDDSVWLGVFDVKRGQFVSQDISVSPNLNALGGDADDGVELSVDDNYLAVLFHADNLGSISEQLRVNLSLDLGVSWTGDFKVGQYDNAVLGHDVDNGVVLVEDSTVAVAWQDNRSGQNEVYSSYADFVSGIFIADHLCSNSTTGAGAPRIAGEFAGESFAVAWSQFSGRTFSSCFLRNGVWSNTFVVSANTGDVRNVRITWNDLYDNFLALWISNDSGVDEVFCGGYRPHQVSGTNLVAGTPGSISLSGFSPGEVFQVVASASRGNLVLPDSRNLGLTYDFLLKATRSLAPFGGVIGLDGTGSTVPLTIPSAFSGESIFFLAVTFDGNGDFSDLSDAVLLDIQ